MSESEVRYVKFRKYAGLRIKGTVSMPKSEVLETSHLERAFYLTAHVESGGKFGAVMNYDGTGMTAGLHQAIAILPKTVSQGSLWKLLRRVELLPGDIPPREMLWTMMARNGVYLAQDSVVRWQATGKRVPGEWLRTLLSGHKGVVLPTGRHRALATAWILAFNELFLDDRTYKLQMEYGKEHFVKAANRVKVSVRGGTKSQVSLQRAVYGEKKLSVVKVGDITPQLDLAMAMYWSNSVNAPGAAKKRLQLALEAILPETPLTVPDKFAKVLIRKLGNTGFARWDDDLKNGRYQRTRRYALKSNLWPTDFFIGHHAIFPKDLPG